MLQHIRPALALLLLMTLLTGVIYPFAITGIAHVVFPLQANGSLIEHDGKLIGSRLIGQTFTADNYFHGRPSATTTADPSDATKTLPSPYNAANSSGSNLGPTSQALVDGVKDASKTLRAETDMPIPVDMVTASGSGLDPHITPAAAKFQIERVSKSRGLPVDEISALIEKHTAPRFLGIFGEPAVNVLELNLALDLMTKS